MAMTAPAKHWTAAELEQIPDDRNRYEIIDGELFVSPSPALNHQELAAQFFERLRAYVAEHRIGTAVFAPADVTFSDDTVVIPDVFVAPLVDGRRPQHWEEVRRLLLAVEVLSPSTARTDRTIKRRRYQRENVPEYWVVDGDARIVERWRPDDTRPEIVSEQLAWQSDPATPPLVIDVARLFEDVFGA